MAFTSNCARGILLSLVLLASQTGATTTCTEMSDTSQLIGKFFQFKLSNFDLDYYISTFTDTANVFNSGGYRTHLITGGLSGSGISIMNNASGYIRQVSAVLYVDSLVTDRDTDTFFADATFIPYSCSDGTYQFESSNNPGLFLARSSINLKLKSSSNYMYWSLEQQFGFSDSAQDSFTNWNGAVPVETCLEYTADSSVTYSRPDSNTQWETRSTAASTESTITFTNNSDRTVKAYWIDFFGSENYKEKINAGSSKTISTYDEYPWVVRDSDTGEFISMTVVQDDVVVYINS